MCRELPLVYWHPANTSCLATDASCPFHFGAFNKVKESGYRNGFGTEQTRRIGVCQVAFFEVSMNDINQGATQIMVLYHIAGGAAVSFFLFGFLFLDIGQPALLILLTQCLVGSF